MYYGLYGLEYLIPAMLLAMYAQYKVKSTYSKYLNVSTYRRKSGAETARIILDAADLRDIPVLEIQGVLSDHYDPRQKVLRLSSQVYHGQSIASVGVAAHEAGHAIQHDNVYLPLMLRSAIVPVVNIASQASTFFILIGLVFSQFTLLLDIGILLFSGAVLFQLITLPVEFNASRRAKKLLFSYGIVDDQELRSVSKVLNAAALTYVASAASAILQMLRLIAIRNRRR